MGRSSKRQQRGTASGAPPALRGRSACVASPISLLLRPVALLLLLRRGLRKRVGTSFAFTNSMLFSLLRLPCFQFKMPRSVRLRIMFVALRDGFSVFFRTSKDKYLPPIRAARLDLSADCVSE